MRTLMLAADNAFKRFGKKAVGQVFWEVPGTYEWIVPPNVHEVSLAMVASGGSGMGDAVVSGDRWSGSGGNLRYINNVAVTPGQVVSIVVAKPRADYHQAASSALGYNTSSPLSATVLGANGVSSNQYVNDEPGGNAGGVVAARQGAGIDLRTFKIVNRPSADIRYGAAGGGGGGVKTTLSPKHGSGGPGAVRIMWGVGRAYPNSNIADV